MLRLSLYRCPAPNRAIGKIVMIMTRAATYLVILATVLSLSACADGGVGSQQQAGISGQPKPYTPPYIQPSGGY